MKDEIKDEMKALILSYLWLFIQQDGKEIGPGDLLTSKLDTGFSPEDDDYYYLTQDSFYDYEHFAFLSKLFIQMMNGSVPGSMIDTQHFFSVLNGHEDKPSLKGLLTSSDPEPNEGFFHYKLKEELKFTNITKESLENYHYLWYFYNQNERNLTLFCSISQ